MNHMQILKRAWAILWSYRALWIFGIIIALTSAGYSGSSNGGVGSSGGTSQPSGTFTLPNNLPPEWNRLNIQMNEFFNHGITPQIEAIIIGVVIGLICLALLIGIILGIANYVSQVALIRMVDHLESTGEKLSWKQGVRLGWSRSAWRLFLIDLIIYVPFTLVILILFGCAAIPVLIGLLAGTTPTILGIIGTIGLFFLFLFLIFLASLVLASFMEVIRRVCVIQEKGGMESIRQGWRLVRQNLKDIFLMWLILLGIRIGYGLVLIPITLLMVLVGILVGGGVGLLSYFGVPALSTLIIGIAVAVAIGLVIFIAILSIPLLFLNGLLQTYLSTSWTLAYRDISPVFPGVSEPTLGPIQPDDALSNPG
ncbi:MAG TPA: hypothetical protein VF326_03065 [Anaerolineaceae bacterium]